MTDTILVRIVDGDLDIGDPTVRLVGRTHAAHKGSLVWAALHDLPAGARRWVGPYQYERTEP